MTDEAFLDQFEIMDGFLDTKTPLEFREFQATTCRLRLRCYVNHYIANLNNFYEVLATIPLIEKYTKLNDYCLARIEKAKVNEA